MLPADSFYVPVDNPEVSSSRHKYFQFQVPDINIHKYFRVSGKQHDKNVEML